MNDVLGVFLSSVFLFDVPVSALYTFFSLSVGLDFDSARHDLDIYLLLVWVFVGEHLPTGLLDNKGKGEICLNC